jgi:hypothetical protein
MLVDLEDIEIFQGEHASFISKPIASFKTADVLRHYDAEFGSKRIFATLPNYISRGVAARLSLCSGSRKSAPASEQLAGIGLLQAARRWNNQARGSYW